MRPSAWRSSTSQLDQYRVIKQLKRSAALNSNILGITREIVLIDSNRIEADRRSDLLVKIGASVPLPPAMVEVECFSTLDLREK